jgi:hypothetical protein
VSYELEWLRFFAFTFLVEAAIAFPLLKSAEASPVRRIGAILVANLTTHPVVFFFFARVFAADRTMLTLVAESWAVLAETGVYALVFSALDWRRAFGVSAVANATSFLLGSLLVHLHVLR